MMDHLMLFVIVAVFALFYWVYYTGSRKGACTANWETLPTREQYLAAHPGAADGDLIFCIHCGHHQQREVGLLVAHGDPAIAPPSPGAIRPKGPMSFLYF